MPPFHSRSAGASRMAWISSVGVIFVTAGSMPRAAAIAAVMSTDLAERGKTPPPALMSSLV